MSLAECSGLGGAQREGVRVRGVGIPPQTVIPIITPITTHLPTPSTLFDSSLCSEHRGLKIYPTVTTVTTVTTATSSIEKDHTKQDYTSDSLTREKETKSEWETM